MSEPTNVPAHIQARVAARQGNRSPLLEAVVFSDAHPKVSIKGSRFRLIDEGNETVVGTTLDVVFVGVNPKVSKVWYDKPYSQANENVRPACFSNDGVRPDSSVETPVHENCAQCPKNVLGSRKTLSGADSKECNDVRFIAVVPSADPNKVYGLTIPVSSMKSFRLYFKDLQSFGLVPEEVITTLSFDDAVSFPKLQFSHRGYVPAKHIDNIEKLVNNPEVKLVTRQVPQPQALTGPARATAVANPPVAKAPAAVVSDEPVFGQDDDAEAMGPPAPTQEQQAEQQPAPVKGKPAKKKEVVPTTQVSDAQSDLEKELDNLFQ